ncbi:hypothetical protein BXZ70DRAFT_87525 [Cristinia sonorae]|uniref:Uncharacterized protein n=1 Tax=Cristinia sonorae TaxID=1940300 RepID=A0A8K0UR00_9AGAR|nr:hypothetical protein BXZ70DRAFT_87525 [Cristinia sonorae]
MGSSTMFGQVVRGLSHPRRLLLEHCPCRAAHPGPLVKMIHKHTPTIHTVWGSLLSDTIAHRLKIPTPRYDMNEGLPEGTGELSSDADMRMSGLPRLHFQCPTLHSLFHRLTSADAHRRSNPAHFSRPSNLRSVESLMHDYLSYSDRTGKVSSCSVPSAARPITFVLLRLRNCRVGAQHCPYGLQRWNFVFPLLALIFDYRRAAQMLCTSYVSRYWMDSSCIAVCAVFSGLFIGWKNFMPRSSKPRRYLRTVSSTLCLHIASLLPICNHSGRRSLTLATTQISSFLAGNSWWLSFVMIAFSTNISSYSRPIAIPSLPHSLTPDHRFSNFEPPSASFLSSRLPNVPTLPTRSR